MGLRTAEINVKSNLDIVKSAIRVRLSNYYLYLVGTPLVWINQKNHDKCHLNVKMPTSQLWPIYFWRLQTSEVTNVIDLLEEFLIRLNF